MSKSSEAVKKWRRSTKLRIVEAMGGSCVCCGYYEFYGSMSLHHLDPAAKELSFGKITANPVNWQKIVAELRKCVMVCLNCHAEVHGGHKYIPETAARFNEDFAEYRVTATDSCPICGKEKQVHKITCSRECAARKSRKVDWDSIDLAKILKAEKNWTHIGERFGVTGTAVKKRAVKLGLV